MAKISFFGHFLPFLAVFWVFLYLAGTGDPFWWYYLVPGNMSVKMMLTFVRGRAGKKSYGRSTNWWSMIFLRFFVFSDFSRKIQGFPHLYWVKNEGPTARRLSLFFMTKTPSPRKISKIDQNEGRMNWIDDFWDFWFLDRKNSFVQLILVSKKILKPADNLYFMNSNQNFREKCQKFTKITQGRINFVGIFLLRVNQNCKLL